MTRKFRKSAAINSADETGAGVIGTAFGASAFIAFLFLATHTLLSLYAGSVLSERAWTAGRDIARSESTNVDSVAASARESLSGFENVVVNISQDQSRVTVHIEVDRPMFLPAALAKSAGFTRLSKTATVRTEDWQ